VEGRALDLVPKVFVRRLSRYTDDVAAANRRRLLAWIKEETRDNSVMIKMIERLQQGIGLIVIFTSNNKKEAKNNNDNNYY
jgi:hypothetical protein